MLYNSDVQTKTLTKWDTIKVATKHLTIITMFKYRPSNNSHITLYTQRNPYSTPGTNTSMIGSVHTCTHTHTHMSTHTHTHEHIHMHTYAHTDTHTHTHNLRYITSVSRCEEMGFESSFKSGRRFGALESIRE